METTTPSDLITAGEARDLVGVSYETLSQWVGKGWLPTYGYGRLEAKGRPSRLYSASELERLARERGIMTTLRRAS